MIEDHFDVIIIGAGPGGEGAAMKSCKSGKKVAVIDANVAVGGACTHTATIPSKAIRYTLNTLRNLNTNSLVSQFSAHVELDFPKILASAKSIIQQQVALRQGFYDRNDVTLYQGHAQFCDANTVEILETGVILSADAFVLATGSRPFRPEDVDFNHRLIRDSDTILELDFTPTSITVYGAGVIGCEYASIFRSLDCKVNLVNTRDKLLEFLDDEIIDALAYHLREQGVVIRHKESYQTIEALKDATILHLNSGKKLKTDLLLWANGRSGNSDKLNLEEIGIEPGKRGQIKVNENYQTTVEHIYAVGDVIGYPNLASASYDQGRFAATYIALGHCDSKLIENIPTGIFTSPEISSIGPTEQQLTDEKVPYEVGQAMFRSLARAQIVGSTTGVLKLLFHRETLEILAIHCFGHEAAEIIHIGQAIMTQPAPNNTIHYFIETTFNYPTMAEAYRVAALNGLNRVF